MAHADKYSPAFSAQAMQKIERGEIPERDMWRYSSFWYKDFDGMAYKTMLRQLISKWGIMSIDMQTAFSNDMAAIHEDGSVDYVDNSADFETVPETTPVPEIATNPATGEVIDGDPTAAFFGEQ